MKKNKKRASLRKKKKREVLEGYGTSIIDFLMTIELGNATHLFNC